MRISDWSSDVCSSDLDRPRLFCADRRTRTLALPPGAQAWRSTVGRLELRPHAPPPQIGRIVAAPPLRVRAARDRAASAPSRLQPFPRKGVRPRAARLRAASRRSDRRRHAPRASQGLRSEEHTSELQSLIRTSYAVFCLKKKTHDY